MRNNPSFVIFGFFTPPVFNAVLRHKTIHWWLVVRSYFFRLCSVMRESWQSKTFVSFLLQKETYSVCIPRSYNANVHFISDHQHADQRRITHAHDWHPQRWASTELQSTLALSMALRSALKRPHSITRSSTWEACSRAANNSCSQRPWRPWRPPVFYSSLEPSCALLFQQCRKGRARPKEVLSSWHRVLCLVRVVVFFLLLLLFFSFSLRQSCDLWEKRLGALMGWGERTHQA